MPFSCFGIRKVREDLEKEKVASPPSSLKTLSKSKSLRLFSCFGF
jgi:hypothetical protein